MRLIDADEVMNDAKHISAFRNNLAGLSDLAIALCGGHTIDAVPVVRCKDCHHWKKDAAGCTEFVGRCGIANYMVGATGYCVYGERKDGG